MRVGGLGGGGVTVIRINPSAFSKTVSQDVDSESAGRSVSLSAVSQ